jgi:hydrogenase maturation protease
VKKDKLLVIGVGNVLMGDDAIGPHVVELLRSRYVMSGPVGLIDGGTAGLALPALMENCDAVILIDTVHSGAAPGTVQRYDREALLSTPRTHAQTPHDPGLCDALLLSELTGTGVPDLVLIGVVPERVGAGIGLSPAVQHAVEGLIDAVLARLGVDTVRRELPFEPDLWWERQP